MESMALVANNLWKVYGDRTVVENVNFTLNPGEVLGLLGPNGAGKTTTLGMLYGGVIPSRGHVQLGSWNVLTQGRQARYQMGIVTQEDNLDQDFTVIENLIYFAHHYRLVGKKALHRAGEVLAQVGLQDYAKYKPDELSGGLKRRLVLARAIINHPKVVFLDEPTTGLDPDARQEFWKLVSQLKQNNCGILLTTHYMDEAQRLCDRLLLLQEGQVINEGTPQELILQIIGKEVVEIEGVNEAIIQQLAKETNSWYRAFGNNYLLTLPLDNPNLVWEKIVATQPTNLTRRRANLEDVFLRLTGNVLNN
ncbi:Phosphonate-transporting ATPase [Crinalium epipsammum PCC 9333]|uniref:Phosphonate-transporting ATPase n=1 Tax=Crinalium epipsammum PCC 9333 TaxID=1173022 RepID=K9VZA5_9CYAN|nr:ABC transporter ATP-binding protein [Crinalium epipsammum]AFZ12485.1 Phosphonate-transporting ATPase [Crinalium epipsammum PCC 9333]